MSQTSWSVEVRVWQTMVHGLNVAHNLFFFSFQVNSMLSVGLELTTPEIKSHVLLIETVKAT